jgi:lipoprotein-anchoring transpeptidase ErfK/SrfK
MLDVREPMTFGDFVWNDQGVPGGPVWVRIDLSKQLISVFRGGHEIGTAVILYGGNGKPTPSGDFTVLQKAADYHSRTYDAAMPYMVRLTEDGVAIHASNVREGWATHGCIGVPREFARHLYDAVKLGDRVSIA